MGSSWGRADVEVRVEGIRKLSKDARALGVSLQDMTDFNVRMAKPIAALARQLAPKGKTKRLSRGIRVVRARDRVAIRLGNATTLKYAAVVHWGRDGSSGPKFMSVAEERLRSQTLNAYDTEMRKMLREHGWM